MTSYMPCYKNGICFFFLITVRSDETLNLKISVIVKTQIFLIGLDHPAMISPNI